MIREPEPREPEFEETDYWNEGNETFEGDYENIAQYYEWEE